MSESSAEILRDRARAVFRLISGEPLDPTTLVTEDYEDHSGAPRGRDAFLFGLGMVRAAFPDWTSTPDELVVEGDRVAARWTVRGTQHGDFMGIPATGRTIVMKEAGILRFEGGRLAEINRVADELSFLRQLGVLPTPPAGGGQ